jgi:hypothetical protein
LTTRLGAEVCLTAKALIGCSIHATITLEHTAGHKAFEMRFIVQVELSLQQPKLLSIRAFLFPLCKKYS